VNAFLAVVMTLVGIVGLLVVLTHDPVRQTLLASLLSLLLALLFFAVQAPDVALSELVIGSAAVPLMVLLAIAKIREQRARRGSVPEREPRE
jgi:energy-converting hydrogenase B subunit D